jgi:hypothetical protein
MHGSLVIIRRPIHIIRLVIKSFVVRSRDLSAFREWIPGFDVPSWCDRYVVPIEYVSWFVRDWTWDYCRRWLLDDVAIGHAQVPIGPERGLIVHRVLEL